MGISIACCIGKALMTDKQEKVLQIVKLDGKITKLKKAVLVKDILLNFSGSSGIGLSKQALEHLPLNYHLKIGKVYYVLPSLASASDTVQQPAVVKRIKVVITKQQLQQLLTKKLSVGEVLSVLEKRSDSSLDSPTNWKPKLESIPEGTELCTT